MYCKTDPKPEWDAHIKECDTCCKPPDPGALCETGYEIILRLRYWESRPKPSYFERVIREQSAKGISDEIIAEMLQTTEEKVREVLTTSSD